MSLLDSAFMESYRQNVVITGSDNDLASIFEGYKPISYEEAIESIYEVQYSMEAMAIMNENAFMMESAGVALVNEGVIGNFFETAWNKIKELIDTVKKFVVACIKKIQDFFRQLYMKATPIDKIMQMYGKKPIDYSDISTAIANGWKIPGTLWLVSKNSPDAAMISEEVLDVDEMNALVKKLEEAMNMGSGSSVDALNAISDALKEAVVKVKEADKENFTWVGQMLSGNDKYTKGELKKSFMVRAGKDGDETKDGSITSEQWDATAEFALHGQSKMRKYQDEVRKDAQRIIKELEKVAKKIRSEGDAGAKEALKQGADANDVGKGKAAINKFASALVTCGSYMANRVVMIANKIVLPVMRKQHTAAIATYVYVTNHVKSSKRKEEKKFKKL